MYASGKEVRPVLYRNVVFSEGEVASYQLLTASEGKQTAPYQALVFPGYTFGLSAFVFDDPEEKRRLVAVSMFGERVFIPKRIPLSLENIVRLHLPLVRSMFAGSRDLNIGGNSNGAALALTIALYLEREHPDSNIDLVLDEPMSPNVLEDEKNWMFELLASEAKLIRLCGEGLCEGPLWLSLQATFGMSPMQEMLLSQFYGYTDLVSGKEVNPPPSAGEAYREVYKPHRVPRGYLRSVDIIYAMALTLHGWEEFWVQNFPHQIEVNEEGKIETICLRGTTILVRAVGSDAFHDDTPVEWYRTRLEKAHCGDVIRINMNGPHVETHPRMLSLMQRHWLSDMNP